MRVSMRSGRIGSAKHNDRSFDLSNVDHIDTIRTGLNEVRLYQVLSLADADVSHLKTSRYSTLEEYELKYYQATYQDQCDITNANYIKQGHPERCKSPDDLYHGKLTRPEELILQIGDMHDDIPRDVFMQCVDEYINVFESWNNEHGQHGQILDVSFHFDESSPHAHIRRVWDYIDKNGIYRLGQNKALEQAGVSLPDSSKKPSRYNNRKMTFDAVMRGKWQDICRAHGFEIETEPRLNRKHKQKAQYIADSLNEEIEALQKSVNASHVELQEAREELENVECSLFEKKSELEDVNEQIMAKTDDLEAIKEMVAQINDLRECLDRLTGSARYEYLKREFKEYTMSMSREGVVALYKDGTIKDPGTNPYGGFAHDVLEDREHGLCSLGKFVNERQTTIPERLLDELIDLAKHSELSPDLQKFVEKEKAMNRVKKNVRSR